MCVATGEAVIPRTRRADCAPLKIFQRYAFTSALKRMSVVAGLAQGQGTSALAENEQLAGASSGGENVHVALVKGAPEVVRPMVLLRLNSCTVRVSIQQTTRTCNTHLNSAYICFICNIWQVGILFLY